MATSIIKTDELRLLNDQVVMSDGALTENVAFPAGHIIQINQYVYSDVYEDLNHSNTIDLPGALGNGTAVITPSSTANDIKIEISLHCGHEDTWRVNLSRVYYRINNGSWTQLVNAGLVQTSYVGGYHTAGNTARTNYIHNFNTIEEIGFKIQHTGHAGGGYLHLNQNNQTSTQSNSNWAGVSSSIILSEIQR